eukprot:scaffold14.g1033.t1
MALALSSTHRPFTAIHRPARGRRNCMVTAGERSTKLAAAAAAALLVAMPAAADVRLPPLDTDPNRCARAEAGNTIGQANGVSDRVLDLRFCKLHGKDLSGKTVRLSGALLVQTDLSGSNLTDVVFSKAYAAEVNMQGANLSNAVVDRVVLDRSNLQGAKFINAVVTGSTFEGANLKDAVFENAVIGSEDAKRLCANPTLTGESREQVGCRT